MLDKVKKQPPNSSQRELAEIFKIPRSTLTRLINKEEELRSRWCEVLCHGHKPAKKLKCLRKGKAPEVDTPLNQWFGTVTSKGQKLSGPDILAIWINGPLLFGTDVVQLLGVHCIYINTNCIACGFL